MGSSAPAPTLRTFRRGVVRRFSIDARALAALRVSLGLLLLADLAIRSRDIVAFYTDSGVLPRALLFEQFPGFARLSLHALSGAAWVQVALFLLAGGFALALVAGYRTTLATAGSFLLLVSLHARNPILLNAGDSLLRRLVFWGMFLPLGERWSVDAARSAEPGRRRVTNLASAALLLQVVLVYAVNAAFKLRGGVWLRGDAIRYVFSLDQLTVLFGNALAQFPTLLELLGTLWLVVVASSALLILLTGRFRAAFALLLVAMHVGMALTLRLGLFPFVSVAGLVPFLPSDVWDALARRFSAPLAPLRARVDELSRPERTLPAMAKLAPSAVHRWNQRLLPVVVAGLLTFVLCWNAAALGYVDAPDEVESVVDPTEHRWDMFSTPRRADGWYVVPGELASGRRVDALQKSSVEWGKPPDVTDAYPSHRWLVYLLDLRRPGYADLRPGFGDYLCRRWNDTHEDDLVRLTVYYVEQPTRFDGREPTRRVELLSYSCSAGGSSGR